MKITPNLHYNGDCHEALQLYEKAFNGEITVLLFFKDADPSDFVTKGLTEQQLNYVYHSEMMIGGQRFMFSDSLKEFNQGQSVSIVIIFDTSAEVRQAYEVMKEGAQILQPFVETTYSSGFVSLVDKFGIRWELMTEC